MLTFIGDKAAAPDNLPSGCSLFLAIRQQGGYCYVNLAVAAAGIVACKLLFECNPLAKPAVKMKTPPEVPQPPPPAAPEPFSLGTLGTPRNSVNWRLESIRQVRVLMGQGYRRIAAQQQIAAALARTVDELQMWERELVQSSDLENELLCSEFAGELLEYLRSGHYTNVPHYKSYGSYSDRYNVARAASIAKTMRQHSLSEIRSGLRLKRRQRPVS